MEDCEFRAVVDERGYLEPRPESPAEGRWFFGCAPEPLRARGPSQRALKQTSHVKVCSNGGGNSHLIDKMMTSLIELAEQMFEADVAMALDWTLLEGHKTLAKMAPDKVYRTTGTATYPPLIDKAIAGAILDSFINNLAGLERLFERKLKAVPSVGGG
jgi:hypothetical protein